MTDRFETPSDSKSKSQLKREMHALQALGEELVRLNAEQLAKIPLSEELREAIAAVRSMNKHGARYRQMQYIGRLMRDIDPAPIQDAINIVLNKDNRATALFHRLEKWRDQLIAGDDKVLEEVFAAFPGADRQHLRHLVRNARKEQEAGKTVKAARGLFCYMRELQEEIQKA